MGADRNASDRSPEEPFMSRTAALHRRIAREFRQLHRSVLQALAAMALAA